MKKHSIYLIFIYLSFCLSIGINDSGQSSTFYDRNKSSTIKVIESDINHTVLEVLINEYEIDEILDNKYLIRIENAVLSLDKGYPSLPKLSTSIIIPDDSDMDISILDFEYEEIDNIDILPSKGNLSRNIAPSSIPYLYKSIYKKNSFYPEYIANLGEPYILRGLRGQGVEINAAQFNPVTKKVRVFSKIIIEISKSKNLNKKRKNSISKREDSLRTSNEFKKIHKNLFINYQSDLRFNYLSDQGNMLIICYDDFINEMQDFVSWKNKKGIPTQIVTLSSIGSSVNDIQNYINNYYSQNGLTYLLLVGDAAQIPTHIVNGSASDPTYGFIEGDDAFSEIIVGRFSANNPSQVAIQVQKTLEYEQNPSAEFEHFNKALGIASNQGPGFGGLSDNDFQDLIWNDFLAQYTYQSYQGVYDGTGSLSEGIDAVNAGVGIINYTGHAGPNGWGNGAPLSSTDVNSLTNTNKLPFIFTVGCNPGQFNDYTESFCESWMWATDDEGNPTGAVGHLGSTISQSWEPPMHGQWAMNAILTESYENSTSRSYGGIAVNGCMHMNEAQGSSGINETRFWTLFGDPSLLVRTDTPAELVVSYNESIIVGQEQLVVDVGVDGALVALSKDGELLSYAYSNSGVALLDLNSINMNPGEIDLVISSSNSYPYQSTLEVLGSEGPYLVYENYELINNSDNLVMNGQLVEMNLLINNIGNMNANTINIEISTNSEFINMIDDNAMIAFALSGQVTLTEDSITFSVAGNAPDGHLANFVAELSDGSQIWQVSFNVEINSPNFEIANPTIVDENMDGVWDAGETATIYVDLINSGSVGFGLYPGATITTDNPYITVLSSDSDNTFFGIDGNTLYQGVFVLESDELTPLSSEVEFLISWGYSTTAPCDEDCLDQAYLSYSSVVGHPSILVWDPSSQHISGNKLVEYFNGNNITGFDYIDNQSLVPLENYKTVFVLLGIYPDNYILQDTDAVILTEFLNSAGELYMEGGDTWAFDSQTSLQSMFGLLAEADGTADLATINGVDNTFTESMSFDYQGGNNFIDRILPSGGFSIMFNSDPEYTTAIAYENILQGYRTIASTHELGGLFGDSFNLYISSLLQFLDEGYENEQQICTPGDLNQDGVVDVIDIIRHVNIIINVEDSPSDIELCASDLNSDEIIDVLDVIAIINIILDRRDISSDRLPFTDNIEIENNFTGLSIQTEGAIRGIEFTVESDASKLSLNGDLEMDTAYNVSDNNHHVLFYSIDGYFLAPGTHKIFESNNHYKIIDFKVSNCNNDLVEINYLSESVPNSFTLKQNYPNPFNPITNIEIDLSIADNINIAIYDLGGRKIRTLVNGLYQPGNYNFLWNSIDDFGQKVPSGIYIYQLKTSNDISTKKMILLK